MSDEPECGVCGSRGTHRVGAETSAPAVGCRCGVIVTGFTEDEATERWELLSRRSEIGRLVEEIADRLTLADTVRLYRTKNPDEYVIEQFGAEHECGVTEYGNSLLDALRALAKEVDCDR